MQQRTEYRTQAYHWSQEQWDKVVATAGADVLSAHTERQARSAVVRQARRVLRAFSSSFFIVTRFLPPAKRDQVELIYAAVRYPDEVVDSFALPPDERLTMLSRWEWDYEAALRAPTIWSAVDAGVNPFAAAFADVVRRNGIPCEHYRSFIAAMRRDACPRPYETLQDLIDGYIYGSAIVVGYFLAHVYGPSEPDGLPRALNASRNLGIALQLTNFLRDVAEDHRRGRVYLPQSYLREAGISEPDPGDPRQREAMAEVVRRVADDAAGYYALARADLDAFAPDTVPAISACIEVYSKLNDRIRTSPNGIEHRESVPITEKFRVLPASKYWKVPLGYLSS